MLIDFSKIPEETIKNFHGGAKEVHAQAYGDELNRIMLTRMIPGSSNGLHTHTDGSEIIFVLKGHGYSITDNHKEELKPGVVSYCKKGSSHEIINDSKTEDLVCYNVITKQ